MSLELMRDASSPLASNVQTLRQVSGRIQESRESRTRLNPKELVDLLLCHGARAWRGSQPALNSRISVMGTQGKPALRMKLGHSVAANL